LAQREVQAFDELGVQTIPEVLASMEGEDTPRAG